MLKKTFLFHSKQSIKIIQHLYQTKSIPKRILIEIRWDNFTKIKIKFRKERKWTKQNILDMITSSPLKRKLEKYHIHFFLLKYLHPKYVYDSRSSQAHSKMHIYVPCYGQTTPYFTNYIKTCFAFSVKRFNFAKGLESPCPIDW